MRTVITTAIVLALLLGVIAENANAQTLENVDWTAAGVPPQVVEGKDGVLDFYGLSYADPTSTTLELAKIVEGLNPKPGDIRFHAWVFGKYF